MKKYLLVIVILSLSASISMAQKVKNDQVPDNIKSEFGKLYPNAKDIEWELDNADYEVEFEIGKEELSAKFDLNGKLLEIEQEIKLSDLPSIVKQSVEKEFPKCEIEEAKKLTLADNVIQYELEIEVASENRSYVVLISSDGKILKKEESKKKEEKKD